LHPGLFPAITGSLDFETVSKLNELINGKRGITADSALDLAAKLGTSPELWLNLQMLFDLRRAEMRRRRAS